MRFSRLAFEMEGKKLQLITSCSEFAELKLLSYYFNWVRQLPWISFCCDKSLSLSLMTASTPRAYRFLDAVHPLILAFEVTRIEIAEKQITQLKSIKFQFQALGIIPFDWLLSAPLMSIVESRKSQGWITEKLFHVGRESDTFIAAQNLRMIVWRHVSERQSFNNV